MKKIIALLLVLGCMLAFVSCFNNNPNNKEDDSDAIPDIQAKIDATAPLGADITVVFKTALGDLNGAYDVTYNEDGTATVDYSYEKFNEFGADNASNEIKSTVEGTVTVAADGTVVGDIGSSDALNAVSFDLKLDANKLDSVSVNAGTLIATVKAANTEAVLGVALNCDAQLTVSTGTNGVTSMTVAYTVANGNVEIVTLYK